jgi:hypothetical protein
VHQDSGLAGLRLQRQPDTELSGGVATRVVTVAGTRVRVSLPHESWWPPLLGRFGEFVSSDDGAALTRCLNVVLTPTGPVLPDGEPFLSQDDDGMKLAFDQFQGVVAPNGDALLRVSEQGPNARDESYVMAVDSLLRIQLAQALAEEDGIMMHAAGIVGPDGEGAVFFGPSGSGKTTMCRLSASRYAILCDEVVAIRLHGGRPVLYGTPFAGAWGRSVAGASPLGGLYRLRHATETSLSALAPASAVREILESTVYYDRSQVGLMRALALVSTLVATVPATELAFEPKEQVWETLSALR